MQLALSQPEHWRSLNPKDSYTRSFLQQHALPHAGPLHVILWITQHGSWWKKRRRDHVTPLLKELHWLPVKFRCQYKIATLAYRHFERYLPPYLSALVNRLALSDLLMKSRSKFQSEISNHLDNVLSFYGTISLEFIASHYKKCTNTVPVQIAAKNLVVCPGLPVESEESCVCVWLLNVDGCIWIGKAGREGRRERAWEI